MDKFGKYRDKEITIISAPFNYGGSKDGAQFGPNILIDFYRINREFSSIEIVNVNEKEDVYDEKLKNKINVIDVNKGIYSLVSKIIRKKHIPVVFGGDHSISSGSVKAVIDNYDDVGVIWIDAHADFNDEKTTYTGNMHGMPLSAVCGLGPECMIDCFQNKATLNPKNIVLIGGRDFDDGEIKKIKENKVKCFLMDDVKKKGIEVVINETIDYLFTKAKNIHISFDIDVISPEYAPGTGTPVENGMNIFDAKKLLSRLLDELNVVSIDFVEFNPLLDESNKTLNLMTSLIDLIIKE